MLSRRIGSIVNIDEAICVVETHSDVAMIKVSFCYIERNRRAEASCQVR
jgi:hypothetical protein